MYTLKSSGFAGRAAQAVAEAPTKVTADTTATSAAEAEAASGSSSSSDVAAAAAAHKCTPMTEFGWKTFDNHRHHHHHHQQPAAAAAVALLQLQRVEFASSNIIIIICCGVTCCALSVNALCPTITTKQKQRRHWPKRVKEQGAHTKFIELNLVRLSFTVTLSSTRSLTLSLSELLSVRKARELLPSRFLRAHEYISHCTHMCECISRCIARPQLRLNAERVVFVLCVRLVCVVVWLPHLGAIEIGARVRMLLKLYSGEPWLLRAARVYSWRATRLSRMLLKLPMQL